MSWFRSHSPVGFVLLLFMMAGGVSLIGCSDDPAAQCVTNSECSGSFECVDAVCLPVSAMRPVIDAGPALVADGGTPIFDAGRSGADSGPTITNDSGSTLPPAPPPLSPLEYEVLSELQVRSDGPAGETPYRLFWNRFGEGSVEAPDLYSENHPSHRHITELAGGPTANFFRFSMHRDIDRDRDRYPEIDDRQRNEIKTFDRSPEAGKGRRGETVRYHWYFRIPDNYAVTRYFNAVMQVKGYGGNSGSPVFAVVAARRGNTPELQMRFISEESDLEYLARTPFESVTGRWLEGEVILTNEIDGYVRATVREVDGPLLLAAEQSNIRTFRSNSEYVRPKWGIYRSVQDFTNLVNETDTLDFADFTVQKVRLLN